MTRLLPPKVTLPKSIKRECHACSHVWRWRVSEPGHPTCPACGVVASMVGSAAPHDPVWEVRCSWCNVRCKGVDESTVLESLRSGAQATLGWSVEPHAVPRWGRLNSPMRAICPACALLYGAKPMLAMLETEGTRKFLRAAQRKAARERAP